MLRRLAERLSRDWTLRRRLSAEFCRAPILVTPSAGLRYLTGRMDAVDPVLMSLAKEFVQPRGRRLGRRGERRLVRVRRRQPGRVRRSGRGNGT